MRSAVPVYGEEGRRPTTAMAADATSLAPSTTTAATVAVTIAATAADGAATAIPTTYTDSNINGNKQDPEEQSELVDDRHYRNVEEQAVSICDVDVNVMGEEQGSEVLSAQQLSTNTDIMPTDETIHQRVQEYHVSSSAPPCTCELPLSAEQQQLDGAVEEVEEEEEEEDEHGIWRTAGDTHCDSDDEDLDIAPVSVSVSVAGIARSSPGGVSAQYADTIAPGNRGTCSSNTDTPPTTPTSPSSTPSSEVRTKGDDKKACDHHHHHRQGQGHGHGHGRGHSTAVRTHNHNQLYPLEVRRGPAYFVFIRETTTTERDWSQRR
jgi:hypothetical protein